MVCSQCGHMLQDHNRFCDMCGAPAPTPKKRARLWPAALALLLIFSFGFGVFLLTRPVSGLSTDTTMPWFTVHDGVLYFDATRYTGGTELTVPEKINGQTVTAISEECFAYSSDLVIIYLPETVTHIGDAAFYGCSSLRGIKLPESLVSIGNYAFSGCVNLEAVCIPYTLEHIGANLFYNCHNLVYFFYPGSAEDWYKLPIGQIRQDSYVYCADGILPAK